MGFKLFSGDCDGDGFMDLIIGSPYSQEGGDKKGHVGIFTNLKKRISPLLFQKTPFIKIFF